MQTQDLNSALKKIVQMLSKHSVKFHLTGGLASSFYGEPRFTQDIDLVVTFDLEFDLASLLSDLDEHYFIDDQLIRESIQNRKMFQALDKETMIKIDFHVGELIDGELSRSRSEEIFKGITAPIVSIEDAILAKLIWIQQGSHKSRQDVELMLKLGRQIDWQYLERSALKFGVNEILTGLSGGEPR
ncbi:MAG: hypothetical protein EA369_00025 [Bradymonadales bacterium]|nr:MAG: hypothetical protein EA369_00025 [Bradymonadales bacterium]